MRLCAALLVSMLCGCHAQYDAPVVSDPGACVVDTGETPCRTIHSHEFQIENHSWGLHDVSVASYERIDAVDRQGSVLLTAAGRIRQYWLWPDQKMSVTQLTIRPERDTVSIDHHRKIYSVLPVRIGGQPYWHRDNDVCAHAAYSRSYMPNRLRDSTIAGIRVVGYSGREDDGSEIKIYYAPSIGCQEFSFEMTRQNSFGLPTYYVKHVVDSYELGPPDPNLFKIPDGYRRVDSIVPMQ